MGKKLKDNLSSRYFEAANKMQPMWRVMTTYFSGVLS